jgi:hypothetical protein
MKIRRGLERIFIALSVAWGFVMFVAGPCFSRFVAYPRDQVRRHGGEADPWSYPGSHRESWEFWLASLGPIIGLWVIYWVVSWIVKGFKTDSN